MALLGLAAFLTDRHFVVAGLRDTQIESCERGNILRANQRLVLAGLIRTTVDPATVAEYRRARARIPHFDCD